MNASNTQTRGNCPLCGREQAVKSSGLMSKHGYTVDHGWFNGVCRGQDHGPMQLDRAVTDRTVSEIRQEIPRLNARMAGLKAGTVILEMVTIHSVYVRTPDKTVAWADATPEQQKRAVEIAVHQIGQRIKAGIEFTDFLESVANRVHGTPLIIAEKPAATVYIQKGEKRQNGDKTYIADYQDGARVYFWAPNSTGKMFRSWMGSKAWRALEMAK